MSGLAGAAKTVSDAIAQLMASTDLAEPRGGTDPEFSDAAKIIQSATAHLMAAQGQSNVITAQAKAIAEAMPMLLAGAKRAAQMTDDDGNCLLPLRGIYLTAQPFETPSDKGILYYRP